MDDDDSLASRESESETSGLLTRQPTAVPGRSIASRLLRYSAITCAACVCIGLIGDKVIARWIMNMDINSRRKFINIRGVEEKFVNNNNIAQDKFRAEPTCPNDGRVCICSHGFHVSGPHPYFPELNSIVPDPGSTACQPWTFQIGDVIMTEKPAANKYWQADLVAKWTNSNVVHAAIVSEVPPAGTPQNGGNVFVTEALKGDIKRVVRNSLKTLVERYPFGGVHIRRVDPARFPFFAANAATITTWLQQRLNEPFDQEMVNPIKRPFTAGERYISPDPWCDTRVKAYNMYLAGGPHMWICSQLVAWALAFPGGLNTNVAYVDPGCSQPHWVVKDLQPNPGDFIKPNKVDYMSPTDYFIQCEPAGCFLALSVQGNTLVSPQNAATPALYIPGTTTTTPRPTTTTTQLPTTITTTRNLTTTATITIEGGLNTTITTANHTTPGSTTTTSIALTTVPASDMLHFLSKDSYCSGTRKKMGSLNGFGFTLDGCSFATKQDPDCVSKKFDFNKDYNGQCQCSLSGCDSYESQEGYSVYQIKLANTD